MICAVFIYSIYLLKKKLKSQRFINTKNHKTDKNLLTDENTFHSILFNYGLIHNLLKFLNHESFLSYYLSDHLYSCIPNNFIV